MTAKPPLNYTTTIAARTTVGECQALLAEAGAESVSVLFTDRQPTGLTFHLTMGAAGTQAFRMPVRADKILALMLRVDAEDGWPPNMLSHRSKARKLLTTDHARDVAWRVVKDWLEAQLALIEAELVTLDQVMLPYLEVNGGESLYSLVLAQQTAITAGAA